MLINKTKKTVEIIYNQVPIVVEPGESLDVRDFDIDGKLIKQVERHIINKNPDVFNVEETKDIVETNKQALKEIESLKKENERLGKALEGASKEDGSAEIISKLRNEIEGFKTRIVSLTDEKRELKAKLKAAQ